MGRHSRSRSRDRERKDKKDKKERRGDSRDRSDRDREYRTERRDHREKERERDTRNYAREYRERERGERNNSSNAATDFELRIKALAARAAEPAQSKWAEPPPDLKIRDEHGNISEDFLKSTQANINNQKQIQKDLGIKFNQHLGTAKTIQPRIDQTDIESRNRFQGSADPYEQGLYGVPMHINPVTSTEKAKYTRKIFIPKYNNFNYTGFIIGPKGTNQKRLEEETGCKILVRGKGSQKEGQPAQVDDNEDLHVLVTADDLETLDRGIKAIEQIIFADEATRNELKRYQLNIMAQMKNNENSGFQNDLNVDLSHTTPYGPPSSDAKTIAVPRDCIGLVIGKRLLT